MDYHRIDVLDSDAHQARFYLDEQAQVTMDVWTGDTSAIGIRIIRKAQSIEVRVQSPDQAMPQVMEVEL